jgi:hypothetical protein
MVRGEGIPETEQEAAAKAQAAEEVPEEIIFEDDSEDSAPDQQIPSDWLDRCPPLMVVTDRSITDPAELRTWASVRDQLRHISPEKQAELLPQVEGVSAEQRAEWLAQLQAGKKPEQNASQQDAERDAEQQDGRTEATADAPVAGEREDLPPALPPAPVLPEDPVQEIEIDERKPSSFGAVRSEIKKLADQAAKGFKNADSWTPVCNKRHGMSVLLMWKAGCALLVMHRILGRRFTRWCEEGGLDVTNIVSRAKLWARFLKREECFGLTWRTADALAAERRDAAEGVVREGTGTSSTGTSTGSTGTSTGTSGTGTGTSSTGTSGTGTGTSSTGTGTSTGSTGTGTGTSGTGTGTSSTGTGTSSTGTTSTERRRPGRPAGRSAGRPAGRSAGRPAGSTASRNDPLPDDPLGWVERQARFGGKRYNVEQRLDVAEELLQEAIQHASGSTLGDEDLFIGALARVLAAEGEVGKLKQEWTEEELRPVLDNLFAICLKYCKHVSAWWIIEHAAQAAEAVANLRNSTSVWGANPEVKERVLAAVSDLENWVTKITHGLSQQG